MRRGICARAFYGTIGAITGLIRFPILVTTILILCTCNVVLNTVVPVRFLRRPLVRLVDIVFARLALLVLGFVRIESSYGNLRRLRLAAKQNKKYPFGYGVDQSDILICNFSSFVQILALSYYFSPTFTGITDRGTAYVLSLPSALFRCFDRPYDKGKYPRSVPLSMIVESKKYDGPIAVFPEVARTNGKGVLNFSAWYGEDETSPRAQMLMDRAHVVAFKFPKQTNSPAQPMETRMGGLCRVFNASLSFMEVTHVNSVHVYNEKKKSPSELRDVMARMIGAKCVQLNVFDYCDFYDYYFS
jgi:hypothetical protein